MGLLCNSNTFYQHAFKVSQGIVLIDRMKKHKQTLPKHDVIVIIKQKLEFEMIIKGGAVVSRPQMQPMVVQRGSILARSGVFLSFGGQ